MKIQNLKKKALISAVLATAVIAGPAAADTTAIVTAMEAVFTDIGTAVGALLAAGAVLFGLIQGGTAVFKVARRIFVSSGA